MLCTSCCSAGNHGALVAVLLDVFTHVVKRSHSGGSKLELSTNASGSVSGATHRSGHAVMFQHINKANAECHDVRVVFRSVAAIARVRSDPSGW